LGIASLFGIKQKMQFRKLLINGLRIGKNCFIGSNVLLDPPFCWLITIGDNCTFTRNVVVLAHDASTRRHIGYTKIGAVTIGNKCFIGVGAIILPGVHIGNNVILGAGCVVTHDIPDNSVAMGNPAQVVDTTENYVKRHETNLKVRSGYPQKGWTLEGNITEENKEKMRRAVEKEIGYVK
jgi:maltose O-acetyltransferase